MPLCCQHCFLSLCCCERWQENSGTWPLGAVDLDLPEAPDSAPRAPLGRCQPGGALRAPAGDRSHLPPAREAPPRAVSVVFTSLTLLPLALLLLGVSRLGPPCTVLYCTALHCSLLYCTALHCTVLYCIVFYSSVLYSTLLYCPLPLLFLGVSCLRLQ